MERRPEGVDRSAEDFRIPATFRHGIREWQSPPSEPLGSVPGQSVMKNVRPLMVATIVLVAFVWLNVNENSRRTTPTDKLAPPTRRSLPRKIKGPRGRAGGIFLMFPNAAVNFRVWFPQGCNGHEEAIDTIFDTYHRNQGRVSIIGIFGVKSDEDRQRAKTMGWLELKDVILINGKQEFVLKTPKGPRRVRFEGFEGRDYAIEDFREVVRGLLGKSPPT